MKLQLPISQDIPVLTLSLSILVFGSILHGHGQTGALRLDGDGDWMSFVGNNIPIGNADFTVTAWVNPAEVPGGPEGGTISFWGNEDSPLRFNEVRLLSGDEVRQDFGGVVNNAGVFTFNHDVNLGSSIVPDGTGPNGDGWHHLAVTYTAGLWTHWYVNGSPIGSQLIRGFNADVAAENFRIGGSLSGPFFNGLLDEVMIYAGTADATVGFDMPGPLQPADTAFPAPLVAYWNFEGGLLDVSGNGNHGTAMGDAMVVPGGMYVVPEPATFALFGLGMASLFFVRRTRN